MNAAGTTTNVRLMIAKVHLGAKELGLDEDTRRELMARVTGKRSAAEMTPTELGRVLDEYRARGWRPGQRTVRKPAPVARPSRQPADHPVARKARALWLSLHQLGAIRDPSETALETFARRQAGCAAMRFMDQGQGFKLIEGLKAIAERHGWDQDVGQLEGEEAATLLRRRLADLIDARAAEA